MTTERWCCDGLCNENQGRGGCPRIRPLPAADDIWERLTTAETARMVFWVALAFCGFVGLVAFLISRFVK